MLIRTCVIILFTSAALLSNAQYNIPEGFTPLFNEKDLSGWHISRTSHQGTTPDGSVENATIVLKQHPSGQGGVLLSNQKF